MEKSSKKPSDNPFIQQKMKMWQPVMTPTKIVVIFLAIGIAFVPTGVSLNRASNQIYEAKVTYDESGSTSSCAITSQNEMRTCTVEFDITEDIDDDLNVYYELDNYYQNHRRYVSSRYPYQLAGDSVSKSVLSPYCDPMTTNGSLLLNPCGLVANSFFNDIIDLNPLNSVPWNHYFMDETGIAWPSDKDKFKQPSGFKYKQVSSGSVSCAAVDLPSSCQTWCDSDTLLCYKYYYPNDDTVQYLYESYPENISPIDGVTDEHFMVWMRTAALPNFRKLYGKISGPFKKGDRLFFDITANYEVASFDGKKRLVVSTVGEFGGKNPYLGIAYIVVGSICLFFGVLFALKQLLFPRPLGDPNLLPFK